MSVKKKYMLTSVIMFDKFILSKINKNIIIL